MAQPFNPQSKRDEFVAKATRAVVRSKSYIALNENAAWLELKMEWEAVIAEHERDKTARSLFDYNAGQQIPIGRNEKKEIQYIDGARLLYQQQIEELQIESYKTILYTVAKRISAGKVGEEALRKHNEIINTNKKLNIKT